MHINIGPWRGSHVKHLFGELAALVIITYCRGGSFCERLILMLLYCYQSVQAALREAVHCVSQTVHCAQKLSIFALILKIAQ